MPTRKLGITRADSSFNLNALTMEQIAGIPGTLTGAIANTAIQASFSAPFNYKIAKVAVLCTALTAVTGTFSFNLVVGTTGAYTQGNIAANDNSVAGPGGAVVQYNTPYPAVPGGMGYPTNVAVVGNSVFITDVPFTAANVFNPAGAASLGSGSPGFGTAGMAFFGTGWQALATGTGGSGLFVPENYDAVYPAGLPLTVRVTVPGASALTNLNISICVEPMALRGAPMSTVSQMLALPGTDF